MNHIAVRNCAACRVKLPKSELIRVVRTPEGAVELDMSQKVDGRGFYWCGQKKCLDRIRKKGLVGRFLKTSVNQELFDRLEEVING